jgi:histidine triad (HIT) family protein
MATLFTKIIRGELPATIVYQDEQVTAFKDIHPVAPVHILIVPNIEIPNANSVEPEHEAILGHMFTVARKVAEQQGIAQSGYRLLINNGPDSGQEVYHLHMHLIGGRRLGPIVVRREE